MPIIGWNYAHFNCQHAHSNNLVIYLLWDLSKARSKSKEGRSYTSHKEKSNPQILGQPTKLVEINQRRNDRADHIIDTLQSWGSTYSNSADKYPQAEVRGWVLWIVLQQPQRVSNSLYT